MFERLFGRSKPDPKRSAAPLASSPSEAPQLQPTSALRDTLYGDMPLEQWPAAGGASPFPWSAFEAARDRIAAADPTGAIEHWREVLSAPGLESRHYLQAWHFLNQHGQRAPSEITKQVLGVVVEVGMPKGLDLLAAYADHSARYYNFSGAGVVWERPDPSVDSAIDALLAAGAEVVARIGPWDKARPSAPPSGQMRLSFLTPSGLHFGQAPMKDLAADPLGGRVVHLATALMQTLIAKSQKKG